MENPNCTRSSSLEPEDLNLNDLNIADNSNIIDLVATKNQQLNGASKEKFDYGPPLQKNQIRLFNFCLDLAMIL